MKNLIYHLPIASLASCLMLLTACSEDFLEPDPLSFYEPSNTYNTQSGQTAALASCDYHLKTVWTGRSSGYADAAPICTEYMFSDVAVNGSTDKTYATQDIIHQLDYETVVDNNDRNRILTFWNMAYNGIKYANSISSYMDQVEGLSEESRNAMLGRSYFHRAFWYYNLIFQFKDVPLLTRLVEQSKFDYRSTKREVILDMITRDLEFSVRWVPAATDLKGMVNKGACRQLLAKCYLAQGEFDKAIAQTDTLINLMGYALMTDKFGTFVNPHPTVWPITDNVIWDLHRSQNITHSANKEAIMVLVNSDDSKSGMMLTRRMRNTVPMWVQGGAWGPKDPSGMQGAVVIGKDTEYDFRVVYGRGIARIRPTWFATNSMWLGDEADLRHNNKVGNWMTMESLKYNNPKSKFYGQNLQKFAADGTVLCGDTIRCWFDWPHYKTWVEDPNNANSNNYDGGACSHYLYRLAETYLLRAEAKMWKGDTNGAAADVNAIRSRAQCSKLFSPSEMTIGVVMDERARELYLEELRHVELSRVSYIFAKTGKTDEFGNTYTVDGLSDSSYWYQRISHYNNFYNKGVTTRSSVTYTIAPYNLFWPIPKVAIDANRKGVLNQNKGYTGYDKNIEPWHTLEDAIADEMIR